MSTAGDLPDTAPEWAVVINNNLKALHEKIDSTTQKLDTVDRRLTDTRQELQLAQTSLANVTVENAILRQTVTNLALTTRRLNEQVISQENYSRKDNLLIHGLAESQNEDTLEIVTKILEKAGLENPRSLLIAACHRLGKFRKGEGKPRSVIVRFVRRKDRDTVFQKLVTAKIDHVRVSHDLAELTLLRRNRLLPVYIEAKKSAGKSAKLVEDRLIIHGKEYTLETLNKLPPELSPDKLSSKTEGGVMAFFSGLHPLSNFSPGLFNVKGINFPTSEHYYQYAKSVTLGDAATAAEILAEPDPALAKRLGDKVERDAKEHNSSALQVWTKEREDHMLAGLLSKFSQNPALAKYLLDTKETVLAEASPSDRYWGTGVSLRLDDACKSSSWTGSNRLGVLLQRVRSDLSAHQ